MGSNASPRRLLAVSSVVVIALSACGSNDEAAPVAGESIGDGSAPVGTAASTDVDDGPVESVEPESVVAEPLALAPEAAEPEPDAAESSERVVGGAECLIGDWEIAGAEMNDYFDVVATGLSDGIPVDFDIEGKTLLTLTASEYTYTADFDVSLEVAGATGLGGSSGSVSGSWEAIDGRIVTTPGSGDLELTVTIADVAVDIADMTNGLLSSAPINDARFDCDGPSISFQADEAGDVRHDVTLTPA
ncbi:MAG: hypothetical protein AB8G26_03435 [Ilumatobacter sp.]